MDSKLGMFMEENVFPDHEISAQATTQVNFDEIRMFSKEGKSIEPDVTAAVSQAISSF